MTDAPSAPFTHLEHTSTLEMTLLGCPLKIKLRLAIEPLLEDGPTASFGIGCKLPVPVIHEDFFRQQIFNAQHAVDSPLPEGGPAYTLLELSIKPKLRVEMNDVYVTELARVVASMVTASCKTLLDGARANSVHVEIVEAQDRFTIPLPTKSQGIRAEVHQHEFRLSVSLTEQASFDVLHCDLACAVRLQLDGRQHRCDCEDAETVGPVLRLNERRVDSVEAMKNGTLRMVGPTFELETLPDNDGSWSVTGSGAYEGINLSTYHESLTVYRRSAANYTGWMRKWPAEQVPGSDVDCH